MGLEPIRPCEHYHLKVACLPIPALSQMVGSGLPTSFKILFHFSTVVYNTNSQVLWASLVGKVGLEPTTAEATDFGARP